MSQNWRVANIGVKLSGIKLTESNGPLRDQVTTAFDGPERELIEKRKWWFSQNLLSLLIVRHGKVVKGMREVAILLARSFPLRTSSSYEMTVQSWGYVESIIPDLILR